MLISLSTGDLQVRELCELAVVRSDSVASLLAGQHSLFPCKSDSTSLTCLEFSANQCLGLVLTSNQDFGVFFVDGWLESIAQQGDAGLQASLPYIISGLSQGTDLVDVVSCLSNKPSLLPEAVIGKVAAIVSKGGQIPQHLAGRINSLHGLLYRYSQKDGSRPLAKLILAARLQHARDLLYASLSGDPSSPVFLPAVYPRIVPSAIWVMHMLIFLFRDIYIYYSTKVLQVDGTVTNFSNEVCHLALLAHHPSRKMISEVVMWIQALNTQLTQALPELSQSNDYQALQAAQCWVAEWNHLPIHPFRVAKFYNAFTHHFEAAWKNAKLPPEPSIPSVMPKWGQDLLEHMRTPLMDQFASDWESTLMLNTSWLSIDVASTFPLSDLQLKHVQDDGTPSSPTDSSWLHEQFASLARPTSAFSPSTTVPLLKKAKTLDAGTSSLWSLPSNSPLATTVMAHLAKVSRSKSIGSHTPTQASRLQDMTEPMTLDQLPRGTPLLCLINSSGLKRSNSIDPELDFKRSMRLCLR
ncbi:hypothetical protein DSO57_1021661 [Entomophthora muscae]|uniref:Uncharacterized protein n=1 Tax=Entomophthora muscae TaxID=34485 RepID=A0ACC2SGB4_9FUNG|nr:hypothetical protein DSO57_1021661 [Entomophthora muscae]